MAAALDFARRQQTDSLDEDGLRRPCFDGSISCFDGFLNQVNEFFRGKPLCATHDESGAQINRMK
jgi:hypothetical protein